MRTISTAATTAALGLLVAGIALSSDTKKGAGNDDTVFISAAEAGPPGLTFIQGAKRVKVGTDKKHVQEILELNESFRGRLRLLDSETPEHTVEIADFYMGTFEVTNEQYKAFVDATKRRPPEHWFGDAIVEARLEFLRKEGEAAKKAKDEGRNYVRKEWDERAKDAWVEANWQTAPWSIPKGAELHPVTYVDFNDARAYAEWAGLRLPTEHEWAYAARGDEYQEFPWGDEWDASGKAHTTEMRSDKVQPAGSLDAGKSKFGIQDLSGGVWEWTASPYVAFDRFKANEYEIRQSGSRKTEKKREEAKFNGAERVVKGGSRENSLLAARVNFRQGVEPHQTASALGFRVAASAVPGRDRAEALWNNVVRASVARKDDAGLDFDGTVGLDRWVAQSTSGARPEGYGVVGDYHSILFIPRDQLELQGSKLDTTSRVWPVTLGVLQTSVPMAEPALEPGVYFVLYRSTGKFLADPEAAEEADAEAKEGEDGAEDKGEMTPEQQLLENVDTRKNLLVFVNAETGAYAGSLPTTKPQDKQRSKVETSITHEMKKVWEGERAADKVQVEQDWLMFQVAVPVSDKRAVPLEFELRVAQGKLGTGWRR